MADSLQHYLRQMLGADAEFRPGQREAIEAVVGRPQRTLVVQRTGWGKSVVYWIATRVLRDAGGGPTLLISPLLSLMRNQIDMASRLGLRADTVNSSNTDTWADVEERLANDECDVLLIAPERLANNDFATRVLPMIRSIGLLVVDEAHCISDWGHDFRPDYRRIGRILATFPRSVPVLATTATANDRVIADVAEQLGSSVTVLRGGLARPSLRLQNIELNDQAERLAWLAAHVPTLSGSGIVYCLTVADTERVAAWLRSRGVNARAYHASLPVEEKVELENLLLHNRIKVLVATVALGMGFDKPDLGFVIHYQRPGSVVAYYQQVGRAGRAIREAPAVLLAGREDDDIAEYFINAAFPPAAHMQAIVDALNRSEGMTLSRLEASVNLRRGHLAKALKLLEIDGAVAREGGTYFRTANRWRPDSDRVERVTEARMRELAEMQRYVKHEGCLMEFLTSSLDDPESRPCGRCAGEGGDILAGDVERLLVAEAVKFLRRDARPIPVRRQWPSNAVPELRGRIQPPNCEGRALCVYGDAGYGRLVSAGKYVDGNFNAELLDASVELIQERWRPDPRPAWVTALPSVHHPGLVGAFAASLAARLRLPYQEVLAASEGPAQKLMENSTQQLRNVARRLTVTSSVPKGPVLLVDDVVDSGWTLTYAGWLLRRHGAGDVLPYALAIASARDDADA